MNVREAYNILRSQISGAYGDGEHRNRNTSAEKLEKEIKNGLSECKLHGGKIKEITRLSKSPLQVPPIDDVVCGLLNAVRAYLQKENEEKFQETLKEAYNLNEKYFSDENYGFPEKEELRVLGSKLKKAWKFALADKDKAVRSIEGTVDSIEGKYGSPDLTKEAIIKANPDGSVTIPHDLANCGKLVAIIDSSFVDKTKPSGKRYIVYKQE